MTFCESKIFLPYQRRLDENKKARVYNLKLFKLSSKRKVWIKRNNRVFSFTHPKKKNITNIVLCLIATSEAADDDFSKPLIHLNFEREKKKIFQFVKVYLWMHLFLYIFPGHQQTAVVVSLSSNRTCLARFTLFPSYLHTIIFCWEQIIKWWRRNYIILYYDWGSEFHWNEAEKSGEKSMSTINMMMKNVTEKD